MIVGEVLKEEYLVLFLSWFLKTGTGSRSSDENPFLLGRIPFSVLLEVACGQEVLVPLVRLLGPFLLLSAHAHWACSVSVFFAFFLCVHHKPCASGCEYKDRISGCVFSIFEGLFPNPGVR